MASTEELTRFICLFHDADRARAALGALRDAGLDDSSFQTLGDTESSTGMTSSESLHSLGVPDRDLNHLQEGLRRGGVLVSLSAPESRSGAIESIFHRYSADKIDETETELSPMDAAAGAGAPVSGREVDAEVIPVAEEVLTVGKREVDRGGVRVFRRTVEQPVRESVDLHEEHVSVDRRPVDRAVTDADVRAGAQEIEVVETAEVPVVQKVARVVEEVRVGKVESDRTEVVEDTVRHTEVAVEDVNDAPGRRGAGRE